MKVLVTGAAGFIASHVSEMLSRRGDSVIGVDNFNDYYDVAKKLGSFCEILVLYGVIKIFTKSSSTL